MPRGDKSCDFATDETNSAKLNRGVPFVAAKLSPRNCPAVTKSVSSLRGLVPVR